MGWEERRGRKYFYRKRWIDGRVQSEYCGRGALAEAAFALDELKRQAREEERQRAIDEGVDRACLLARHLIYAALLLNGYHMHRGEWRKRR